MNITTCLCPVILGLAVLVPTVGCRGDRMVSRPYTAEEMQWGVMIQDSYPGWRAPFLSPRREDRSTPWSEAPAGYTPAAAFRPSTPRAPALPATVPARSTPPIVRTTIAPPVAEAPATGRTGVFLPPVRVEAPLSPSKDWCPQDTPEPDYELVPAEGAN